MSAIVLNTRFRRSARFDSNCQTADFLSYPPLEGEGRLLERSESGRGGVNCALEIFTPPRSLSLATLPLLGRVKRSRRDSSPVLFEAPGRPPSLFRSPEYRGCGAPKGAPVFRVCTLSPECRASRRATAASSGSRAALSAAIGLPEGPSDMALLGTMPFRASGKANGFAPSASSSQQVLLPAGGAPAPPERDDCVCHRPRAPRPAPPS